MSEHLKPGRFMHDVDYPIPEFRFHDINAKKLKSDV